MKTNSNMKRNFFLLFVFVFIFAGCSTTYKIRIEQNPPKTIEGSNNFQAGAARVDITPPPGYPMGGFGIGGRTSRGWWTHLYAKSIYLEDRKGNGIVLVACDLWSLPAGLADKVAEIISKRDETAHIAREQIILAATHTHHSPGNFSSSGAYNTLASPGMGFDESLFQFLVDRIALAIARAVESRQPAVVKQGTASLINLSRNRSLAAFARNSNSLKSEILARIPEDEIDFSKDLPASVDSATALRAVDPTLTVLKIEGQSSPSSSPIAIAAFFAVHPTAMGTKTEVYSSDIFGVASTLVEQHIKSEFSNGNSVVAIFNGAEGDISPNWKKQDRRNTLEIGEGIAQGILTALADADETNKTVDGDIEYRFENIDIADQEVKVLKADSDSLCSPQQPTRTAKKGKIGVATFGGAEDGRTLFYNFGLREGVTSNRCDPQHGRKLSAVKEALKNVLHVDTDKVLGKLISNLIEDYLDQSGPRILPLGVYTVGSVILATAPGEITVALGHRITKGLKDATGREKSILIVGIANEYLSYFTTPREYSVQHYEGASTLFGQVSGVFVGQELSRLAKASTESPTFKRKKTYDAGERVASGFGTIKNDRWQLSQGLENILQEPETGHVQLNFPQFTWPDKVNYLSQKKVKPSEPVNPVVSMEVERDGSWESLTVMVKGLDGREEISVIESDTTNLNFVTVIPTVQNDLANWHSVWLVPGNIDSSETVRFLVRTPQGNVIKSKPFEIRDVLTGKTRPIIKIDKPEKQLTKDLF